MSATGVVMGPVLGPSCKKGKGSLDSSEAGIRWSLRYGAGRMHVIGGIVSWGAITSFELARLTPAIATLAVSYLNGKSNDPAGFISLVTRKWNPPRYSDGWLVSKPSLFSIAYHAEMYLDPDVRRIEDSGAFGPTTGIKYEQDRFDRACATDRREHVDLHLAWQARGYKRYPGPDSDSDDSFYDWIAAGTPDSWSPEEHRQYAVSYVERVGGWTWPPIESPELANASAEQIWTWLRSRGRRLDS